MPGTPSTSPRFGAPRFTGSDPVDFPGNVNGVTDAFDAKAARWEEGLLAARPSTGAGIAGRLYTATDDTSGGPDGTTYRDAGGAVPTWKRINIANAEAAFSTWKPLPHKASTNVTPQGAGGTFLASTFGNISALGTAGTVAYTFRLDPGDFPAGSRTTKLRLRTTYVGNAVAPGINIIAELRPVTATTGASGSVPGVSTVGTAVVTNSYLTPAANANTPTDSTEVTFPTAGLYVFTVTLGGAGVTGSAETLLFELEYRQV